MLRNLLVLAPVLLVESLAAQEPSDSGPVWWPTDHLLVAAADADRSGDVSAAEWAAFRGGAALGESGALDHELLIASILRWTLDLDRDGATTIAELEPALARRDGDGDGSMTAAELEAFFDGAPDFDGPVDALFLEEFALGAADVDGDGAVTGAEWGTLLELHGPGEIAPQTIVQWMRATPPPTDADRTAFTPSVYLLTLRGELDANRDGALRPGDLDAHFAAVDADGDGAVSAGELVPTPEEVPAGPPAIEQEVPLPGQRPLVRFQRNLADALALVERTGRPLLVCVNMNGEPASEQFALIKYRDPAFAALTEGFVPVIASPDVRHLADYDDRGRRLPDERFGRIVNTEARSIDPLLLERYYGGERVAPRHIGVAPDGTILFDIFLVQDLSIVDDALREHGVWGRSLPDAGTLTTDALLESYDAGHRSELERRFVESPAPLRAELVTRGFSNRKVPQHPDLILLGLRDPDADVRAATARTVAVRPELLGPGALFSALRIASGSPGELDRLVRGCLAALRRGDAPEAAPLQAAARAGAALLVDSRVVDRDRWMRALDAGPAEREEPIDPAAIDALIDRLEKLDAALRDLPGDAGLELAFARTALRAGRTKIQRGEDPTLFLEDALARGRRAAHGTRERAAALGVAAQAAHLLGQGEEALQLAVEAASLLADDAASDQAAEVLRVLVFRRVEALYADFESGAEWPAAWLADVLAATEVLLAHPSCVENDVVVALGVTNAAGAWAPQAAWLHRILTKFPSSNALHGELRMQALRDGGADALDAAYAAFPAELGQRADWLWYRGLAHFVAAEHRTKQRATDAALASYAASAADFASSIALAPGYADSATHYVCLGGAGAARLHAARGAWSAAVDALTTGLAARPATAEQLDGLGDTPLNTARTLARDLRGAGQDQLLDRLDAALAAVGLEL